MTMGPSPDDLLAGGIPLGDEEEEEVSGFLGVPKGYVAVRTHPVDPSADVMPVVPRYKEGDQYRPQSYAPELRVFLQAAMDRAGLYKKGQTYTLGDWQETDSVAYAAVLRFANRYGYSEDEALAQMRTLPDEERARLGLGGAGGGGGAGDGRPPLLVSLSHPDDIRSLADQTARKTLGKKLSPDQLNDFVAAYHSMQQRFQRQEYSAGATGGTVTEAPSPTTYAETQIEAIDPVGTAANKTVDVFKVISGALGGLRGER